MDLTDILTQLKHFFPGNNYSADNFKKFVSSDELTSDEESISNTLKGALLDENLVEVQLQDLEKVFFCRILDSPDEIESLEEDEDVFSYEKGSYLDYSLCVIVTPLEPSEGNYLICSYPNSKVRVLLRIISYGNAFEFCCFYEKRTLIGDMPVLRLTFPFIRRKTPGAREYRARVPSRMKFRVTVERPNSKPLVTSPLNISLKGMALLDPMKNNTNLKVGETVVCDLMIPKGQSALVEATIIHVTRLRDSKGLQYCFGVQFDISKPATRTAIEKIVSSVQRVHLRELSDLEEKFGVSFDKV